MFEKWLKPKKPSDTQAEMMLTVLFCTLLFQSTGNHPYALELTKTVWRSFQRSPTADIELLLKLRA